MILEANRFFFCRSYLRILYNLYTRKRDNVDTASVERKQKKKKQNIQRLYKANNVGVYRNRTNNSNMLTYGYRQSELRWRL